MDFDVIVIGGGSAGTAAASAAAAAGARVAMVNDGELGGLCILRGCMPTKTILHSAHALHEMRHAGPLGIEVVSARPRFAEIMRRKDEKVARFKRAKVESIEASGYEVIDARARFVDRETLEVGGRPLRARGYVIATGSVPAVPAVPGIREVPFMTSDDVMRLTEPPASLVIQGAGPVGLELGQFFARMGAPTTLVNRSPVCSKVDADCSAEMTRVLNDEENFTLHAPGRILSVGPSGSRLRFEIESGGRSFKHDAAAFLVATGRNAAVDGLGLERAGVEMEQGRIRRDAAMRTSNPAVFVAGDATGDHQILHLANQEGRVAGHNVAGGRPGKMMDYRLKMSVIFTDPPMACVGMNEKEAAAAGRTTLTALKRIPSQGRAITMEARHGIFKVVADAQSCEILGAQILGPRADDLIHVISAIMHYRGKVQDLAAMPWYHPTLAESLIEIARKFAAQVPGCEAPPAPPA